jgi:hypothetical protein
VSFKINHAYLLLALGPILLFQNCGSDYQPTSLYVDDGAGTFYSQECISAAVDCGPKSEFLLVSIDTQDPLILLSTSTSYVISGRCNTGNYPEHSITYEVINAVGTRVLRQVMVGMCISGRYQFSLPLSTIANNQNHSLLVTITGIDDQGRSFTSTQSGGSDRIDFFKQ